tara:strand:- start:13684 stop:14148 length:465 start_codon:yes stop_codon:yes gene_type:complete
MSWEDILRKESSDLDSTRAEAQKLANSSGKTVYLFHKINGTYWFSNLYDDPFDGRTNPSLWTKFERIEPDKSLETAETLKSDVDVRARELIESTKRDPLMRELKRLQKEYDRIKNVHSHTKRKNNVDYKRYGASREREMSELKRRIDEIKEELQ